MKLLVVVVFVFIMFQCFSQDFKKHQWKNRVLIVSTIDDTSSDFLKQIDLLKNLDQELKERKLIVYQIVDDKYKVGFSSNFKSSNSISNKYVNTKKGVQITLIGLDGGVKLKQNSVLITEKLFAIIDGMPMRKRELRKNK